MAGAYEKVGDSDIYTGNASALYELMRDFAKHLGSMHVIDTEGNFFGRAIIEKRKLSDGSEVYNLVLERTPA